MNSSIIDAISDIDQIGMNHPSSRIAKITNHYLGQDDPHSTQSFETWEDFFKETQTKPIEVFIELHDALKEEFPEEYLTLTKKWG